MKPMTLGIIVFITWILSGISFDHYSHKRIYQEGYIDGYQKAKDSAINDLIKHNTMLTEGDSVGR